MTKFLAVVKREYLQRVRTKFFAVMTVLGPVLLVVFTVVPGLLAGYKAGHDTRIAIVDQTDGKLYASIRSSLLKQDRGDEDDASAAVADAMNSNTRDRMQKVGRSFGSFFVEQVNAAGRPLADIKRELNARIGHDELEGSTGHFAKPSQQSDVLRTECK